MFGGNFGGSTNNTTVNAGSFSALYNLFIQAFNNITYYFSILLQNDSSVGGYGNFIDMDARTGTALGVTYDTRIRHYGGGGTNGQGNIDILCNSLIVSNASTPPAAGYGNGYFDVTLPSVFENTVGISGNVTVGNHSNVTIQNGQLIVQNTSNNGYVILDSSGNLAIKLGTSLLSSTNMMNLQNSTGTSVFRVDGTGKLITAADIIYNGSTSLSAALLAMSSGTNSSSFYIGGSSGTSSVTLTATNTPISNLLLVPNLIVSGETRSFYLESESLFVGHYIGGGYTGGNCNISSDGVIIHRSTTAPSSTTMFNIFDSGYTSAFNVTGTGKVTAAGDIVFNGSTTLSTALTSITGTTSSSFTINSSGGTSSVTLTGSTFPSTNSLSIPNLAVGSIMNVSSGGMALTGGRIVFSPGYNVGNYNVTFGAPTGYINAVALKYSTLGDGYLAITNTTICKGLDASNSTSYAAGTTSHTTGTVNCTNLQLGGTTGGAYDRIGGCILTNSGADLILSGALQISGVSGPTLSNSSGNVQLSGGMKIGSNTITSSGSTTVLSGNLNCQNITCTGINITSNFNVLVSSATSVNVPGNLLTTLTMFTYTGPTGYHTLFVKTLPINSNGGGSIFKIYLTDDGLSTNSIPALYFMGGGKEIPSTDLWFNSGQVYYKDSLGLGGGYNYNANGTWFVYLINAHTYSLNVIINSGDSSHFGYEVSTLG